MLLWISFVLSGFKLQRAQVLLVACTRLALDSADVAGGAQCCCSLLIAIAESWLLQGTDGMTGLMSLVRVCHPFSLWSTFSNLRVLV